MSDSRADLLKRRPAAPRWPVVALIIIVVVGLATVLASTWRLRSMTAAAPTPRSYTVATAGTGAVSQSLPVRVDLTWKTEPVARNLLAGTVTSVAADHVEGVGVGKVIYSVDLRPVFIATGATPAFRDLAEGAVGPDVRQLQEMLVAEKVLYTGVDGVFGRSTRSAVERWQKAHDEDETGVVALGRVLFVPRLPALLRVDPETITVGARLSGGEPAVLESSSDPQIEASLPSELVPEVDEGDAVSVETGAARWTGVVRSVDLREDGVGVAAFGQVDGTSCGSSCPFGPGGDGTLHARGEVVIVPRTAGTVIPVAALLSNDDGSYVVDVSGRRHRVTVRASASGRAVVEGIEPGQRVRVTGAGGR